MAGEKVGELYAELGITDLTERQLRAAEAGMEQAARRMDRIDDPRLDVDTDRVEPELQRTERRLRDARGRFIRQGEIPVTIDPSGIDDGAAEGERRLTDMVGGWASAVVIAAGLIGVAAGKEFAKQFMDWAERDAETDRLGAKLGLSEEEAARYGKLAGQIYADNFGESVPDVTEALFQGQANGVIDLSSSDEEIRKLTERALTFTSLFGQDMSRTMAAVSTMLKTGMAKDAEEAFDILTTGAQNGTNKADDLLDTFIEYSTMFRSLGIDGQTALGLLSQGLEGGARDADTVADAIKEFSIRGKDGSETTRDALAKLGLDADDVAGKLGRGGKDAADAFDDVLDRLRKTGDPVERNAIAVGLFGTKAEDLQKALGELDPSEAAKGFDDLAGAAERAQETAGDNVAGSLESLQRRTKMSVEDYLGSLWEAYDEGGFTGLTDKLAEDTDKLGKWWDENGDKVTDALTEWWNDSGKDLVGAAMAEGMELAWDVAWAMWWDYVGDPENWPIVGGFVSAGEDIVDAVGDFLGDAVEKLAGIDWGEAWSDFGNSFIDVLNAIIGAWNDFELKLPSFDGLKIGGQTVIPGWEGPTLGTPDIDELPHFDVGGPVLAPVGSPVLAVIHGGEYVQRPEEKAAQDRYIRDLERQVAAAKGAPARPAGGTTNIYAFNPERYMRDMPWSRAG